MRVTINRRHTGRIYVGLDQHHFEAIRHTLFNTAFDSLTDSQFQSIKDLRRQFNLFAQKERTKGN